VEDEEVFDSVVVVVVLATAAFWARICAYLAFAFATSDSWLARLPSRLTEAVPVLAVEPAESTDCASSDGDCSADPPAPLVSERVLLPSRFSCAYLALASSTNERRSLPVLGALPVSLAVTLAVLLLLALPAPEDVAEVELSSEDRLSAAYRALASSTNDRLLEESEAVPVTTDEEEEAKEDEEPLPSRSTDEEPVLCTVLLPVLSTRRIRAYFFLASSTKERLLDESSPASASSCPLEALADLEVSDRLLV